VAVVLRELMRATEKPEAPMGVNSEASISAPSRVTVALALAGRSH